MCPFPGEQVNGSTPRGGLQTAIFDRPSDWDREIKRTGASEWRVCSINENYAISPRFSAHVVCCRQYMMGIGGRACLRCHSFSLTLLVMLTLNFTIYAHACILARQCIYTVNFLTCFMGDLRKNLWMCQCNMQVCVRQYGLFMCPVEWWHHGEFQMNYFSVLCWIQEKKLKIVL